MARLPLPPPPRRVLIVDDSPAARGALAAALARHGFSGEEVEAAGDALRRLLYEEYALAFVDLHMPVVDGVQLLRLLRARGGTVPVVLVTATSDMHLVRDAVKLGVADYLPKPFDDDAVGSALGRIYGIDAATLRAPDVEPPK